MKLKDEFLLRDLAYFDGAWIAADSGVSFPVVNPATGIVIANVPNMGRAETERAVAAAAKAGLEWQSRSAKERAVILRRWFEMIMANQHDLAALMTAEQGKPLDESMAEIAYAASFVEWYAEEAKRIYGDIMAHPKADHRIMVLKQPVGVCAAITPWNFPSAMITRKAAPALAAGCTMVIKPAEQTPLSALALCVLAERAGIPAGVLNVVTADGLSAPAVGSAMTASPIVRKLTFTGSTEIGRILMRDCANTVKKVSLELGGNAPFIVFDDADLDAAVDGLMASKFRNMGQTCVCANRVLVQEKIYDVFAKKLALRVSGLSVGDGAAQGITQGPLIDDHALAKVEEHIADAVSKGAKVLIGGKRHALGGTYFEPTVLVNADQSMKLFREETFGPVAPLLKFATDDDAIRMANDSESGLAAYFYSTCLKRLWHISEALETGIIGVNAGLISNEVGPFGGLKQSGLGREGSKYGIEEYLEIKYLCLGGLDKRQPAVTLA